jgi:hypothetical protein
VFVQTRIFIQWIGVCELFLHNDRMSHMQQQRNLYCLRYGKQLYSQWIGLCNLCFYAHRMSGLQQQHNLYDLRYG